MSTAALNGQRDEVNEIKDKMMGCRDATTVKRYAVKGIALDDESHLGLEKNHVCLWQVRCWDYTAWVTDLDGLQIRSPSIIGSIG